MRNGFKCGVKMANHRKHLNAVMVTFYMPMKTIEQVDEIRGVMGRGELITYLIGSMNGSEEVILKIQKQEEEIKQLKLILKQKKSMGGDSIDKIREEALKTLILKPYKEWTPGNKIHARDTGKFRSTKEMEEWIMNKQRGII